MCYVSNEIPPLPGSQAPLSGEGGDKICLSLSPAQVHCDRRRWELVNLQWQSSPEQIISVVAEWLLPQSDAQPIVPSGSQGSSGTHCRVGHVYYYL